MAVLVQVAALDWCFSFSGWVLWVIQRIRAHLSLGFYTFLEHEGNTANTRPLTVQLSVRALSSLFSYSFGPG